MAETTEINISDLVSVMRELGVPSNIREVLGENADFVLKEYAALQPGSAYDAGKNLGDSVLLEASVAGFLKHTPERAYQVAQELNNEALVEQARATLFSNIDYALSLRSERLREDRSSEYFEQKLMEDITTLFTLGVHFKDEELIKSGVAKYSDIIAVSHHDSKQLFDLAKLVDDKSLLSKTAQRLLCEAEGKKDRSVTRYDPGTLCALAYEAATLAEDSAALNTARTKLLALNTAKDARGLSISISDLFSLGYAHKDGVLLDGIFGQLLEDPYATGNSGNTYRAAVVIGDPAKKQLAVQQLVDATFSVDYICELATELGDTETIRPLLRSGLQESLENGYFDRAYRAAGIIGDKDLKRSVVDQLIAQRPQFRDMQEIVAKLYL